MGAPVARWLRETCSNLHESCKPVISLSPLYRRRDQEFAMLAKAGKDRGSFYRETQGMFACAEKRHAWQLSARHRPLQSEISHRSTSVAIIRRMAYSLAKPRGAADRASPDGRLPLPLEGPGGVATEDARRSERLIGNCRARRPRPGNVGVEGRASDRPTDWRIPPWHHPPGRESS